MTCPQKFFFFTNVSVEVFIFDKEQEDSARTNRVPSSRICAGATCTVDNLFCEGIISSIFVEVELIIDCPDNSGKLFNLNWGVNVP